MAENVSVITIDVVDEAFREFTALFSKYKTDLAALPGGWAKVDKEIKKISNPFEKIQKSVKAVIQPFVALREIAKTTSSEIKKAATSQDKFRIAALGTGKALSVVAKSSVNMAKSIGSITANMMKWGGYAAAFGGALVGGSLFGIDRLAAAQGDQRKRAQGLGASTAEVSASRISFDKTLDDVEGTLAKINEAKHDFSKRAALSANGITAQDFEGSTVSILEKLISKAKDTTEQGGKNYLQLAGARQLTEYFSAETLSRINEQRREELNLEIASNQDRKKKLAQNEQDLRKWQDFIASLDTAGQHIQNVLGDHLVRLAGPLGELSTAFSDAVAKLLDTGKVDEWINVLSTDIKRFADWLGSDEAEKDFRDFLDGVDVAVGYLEKFALGIGKILSLIPGMGGNALKGSQYKKLDEIAKIDPELAKELRYKLENPDDYKANSETSFLTGKKIKSQYDQLLEQAQSGPSAERVNQLIKALDDNTKAVSENTDIDFGQPSEANPSTSSGAKSSNSFAAQATKSSANQSTDDVAALAKATQDKYGIPASVTLAQYNLESGGGKHMPAGSNNPFGIKAKAGQPYVEAETTEVINGVSKRIMQKFAKFDSLADAFDAHAKLLATAPTYAKARAYENNPEAFADALTGTYATDPKYGEKLKKAMRDQMPRQQSDKQIAQSASNNVASSTNQSTSASAWQPVKLEIYKSPGADVYTTVNGMTPVAT